MITERVGIKIFDRFTAHRDTRQGIIGRFLRTELQTIGRYGTTCCRHFDTRCTVHTSFDETNRLVRITGRPRDSRQSRRTHRKRKIIHRQVRTKALYSYAIQGDTGQQRIGRSLNLIVQFIGLTQRSTGDGYLNLRTRLEGVLEQLYLLHTCGIGGLPRDGRCGGRTQRQGDRIVGLGRLETRQRGTVHKDIFQCHIG